MKTVILTFIGVLFFFNSVLAATFEVDAEIIIDGVVVSNPKIKIVNGVKTSIIQKISADESIEFETSASYGSNNKNIVMDMKLYKLGKDKSRKVLSQPRIQILQGEHATVAQINKGKVIYSIKVSAKAL